MLVAGDGDGDASVFLEGMLDRDFPFYLELTDDLGEVDARVTGGKEIIGKSEDFGVGGALTDVEGAEFTAEASPAEGRETAASKLLQAKPGIRGTLLRNRKVVLAAGVGVSAVGARGLAEEVGKFWIGFGTGEGPRQGRILDLKVLEGSFIIEDVLRCIGCLRRYFAFVEGHTKGHEVPPDIAARGTPVQGPVVVGLCLLRQRGVTILSLSMR